MADEQIVRFRFTGDTTELATATARAETGLKGTATAANTTTRALGSVAQQIPDVITQLQMGTDATTVFVQQGLQVAQVNMDLLTKAARVAGPAVAVALAGAATAAITLKNAIAESRDEMGNLRAGADQIAGILAKQSKAAFDSADGIDAVSAAAAEARLQTAVLTGEITEQEAALQQAQAQIRASAEDSIVAQRRLVAVQNEAIKKQREIVAAELIGSEARQAAIAEIERLESLRDQAIETLKAQGSATNDALAAARDLAEAQAQVAAAQELANLQAREAARLAREQAEERRRQERHDRERKDKAQKAQDEIARVTEGYQRRLSESTAQTLAEEAAAVEAALARREARYEEHFARVASLSQTFGSQLVEQQGNIGAALVETGRQALAAETANLAQEFALRAAAYALVGNLPQAAAYAAGSAALGVSSGAIQAGGLRALNGSGIGRGLRSGRR